MRWRSPSTGLKSFASRRAFNGLDDLAHPYHKNPIGDESRPDLQRSGEHRGALLFGACAMGCRCNERAQALRSAVKAGARGDVAAVARDLSFIGKTLREDVRSGDLARVALQRLSVLRAGARRR